LYTNVYKIFCVLRGVTRVKAYWSGVGTYAPLDKVPMGITGMGGFPRLLLSYQFVVANYEPGDRIHIFGFSRGAYIARHLAGLITRAGLDRRHLVQTRDVVLKYVNRLSYEPPEAGVTSAVQFLGLWDTVAGWRGSLTIRRHSDTTMGVLKRG
jgi:uncharacterized protein (DUF2235 family)